MKNLSKVKKKENTNQNTFWIKICIIVLIIIINILIYILSIEYLEYKDNKNDLENLVSDVVETNNVTFEKHIDWIKLKNINSDITGWIEINNSNINYPILSYMELFYINHNHLKKNNKNGAIFLNENTTFENQEIEIYGHNMQNDMMFSELNKYLDNTFLENSNINIYTPSKNYIADIFSVYTNSFDIEKNNIKNLEYEERIKYYLESSQVNIENEEVSDKIVKLVTCSYEGAVYSPTEKRLYVVAYLHEKI